MHYVFYVIIANIFETFFPFFFNSITLIRYYCFKRSPDILFFTCENETRVHCNCRCTRTTSDTIVKFELIVEYVTRPLKKKKKIVVMIKGNKIYSYFSSIPRITRSKFQYLENSQVISSMDIKVKVSTFKILIKYHFMYKNPKEF